MIPRTGSAAALNIGCGVTGGLQLNALVAACREWVLTTLFPAGYHEWYMMSFQPPFHAVDGTQTLLGVQDTDPHFKLSSYQEI